MAEPKTESLLQEITERIKKGFHITDVDVADLLSLAHAEIEGLQHANTDLKILTGKLALQLEAAEARAEAAEGLNERFRKRVVGDEPVSSLQGEWEAKAREVGRAHLRGRATEGATE